MTRATNAGAQRRSACAAGAQARRRRHWHRIANAQLDFFGTAAPADPLLGSEEPSPFRSRSRTEEVAAADGVGGGP